MADFHQGGAVATLHNLTNRSIEELESELVKFSERRPMGLLLPSLFSELETDAMPQIISEVKQVPYLNEIVIGLDRATEGQYREALKFFSVSAAASSGLVERWTTAAPIGCRVVGEGAFSK